MEETKNVLKTRDLADREEKNGDVENYSLERFEEYNTESCLIVTNETSVSDQVQVQEQEIALIEELNPQIQQAQPEDSSEGLGANLLEPQETQPIGGAQVDQQHQEGEQAQGVLPEPQQTVNTGLSRDYLFALVNSISSTNLLSEESIDILRELLCPPQATFDSISLKDPSQVSRVLEGIVKEKSISANNALGNALNYYHKSLMDSQIHHLDKFIRVIKSKRREMHLQTVQNNARSISHLETVTETLEAMHNVAGLSTANADNQLTQNPLDIISLLDYNRLGAMVIKKRLIPQYNSSDKSITIRINDKYEVKLKILNDTSTTHKSRIDRIPQHILQTYIFPYLTSSELFSMRTVCNEWRELIRGIWHVVFKREMLEQVVAADICNDIEMHFKLMQIRTPFYQKFGVFMKAIAEMIDWTLFEEALRSEDLCKNRKMLIITLLKLLGYKVDLQRLYDFQESDWEEVKDITAIELRAALNKVLQTEFVFEPNVELQRMKKHFLDVPDLSSSQFKDFTDKNWLMLSIFMRQMYVFGLLRNNILISQKYVTMAKDKLKEISNGWTQKKGFLEGAYKILLFRYVKFINGQIIVPKDEEEEVPEHSEKPEQIINNLKIDENALACKQLMQNEQINEQSTVCNPESYDKVPLQEVSVNDNQSCETNHQSEMPTSLKEVFGNDSTFGLEKQLDSSKNSMSVNDVTQLREKVSNANLQEFQEIKRFYSQDIEASLDRLVKKFVENSKANKTGNKPEPDYIITKNGTETHIFLDDETRLEVLIQKFLKFHLLIMRLNCQIQSHVSTAET